MGLSETSMGAPRTPKLERLRLLVANTVYQYTLPAGTRLFFVRPEVADDIRMAFKAGVVASPPVSAGGVPVDSCWILGPDVPYASPSGYYSSLVLYLLSPSDTDVDVDIECWGTE